MSGIESGRSSSLRVWTHDDVGGLANREPEHRDFEPGGCEGARPRRSLSVSLNVDNNGAGVRARENGTP
jgi:hypothetical protein